MPSATHGVTAYHYVMGVCGQSNETWHVGFSLEVLGAQHLEDGEEGAEQKRSLERLGQVESE